MMGAIGAGEGPASTRSFVWGDHGSDPSEEIDAGDLVSRCSLVGRANRGDQEASGPDPGDTQGHQLETT